MTKVSEEVMKTKGDGPSRRAILSTGTKGDRSLGTAEEAA